MNPHHKAWLKTHPDRDQSWLSMMLREGFDVHHMDGDHDNDVPDNLVLIEYLDHQRLHGASLLRPLNRFESNSKRLTLGESAYRMRQSGMMWAEIGIELYPEKKGLPRWRYSGCTINVAKAYAEYHKFEWPVKRLPGAKNTEGKF